MNKKQSLVGLTPDKSEMRIFVSKCEFERKSAKQKLGTLSNIKKPIFCIQYSKAIDEKQN